MNNNDVMNPQSVFPGNAPDVDSMDQDDISLSDLSSTEHLLLQVEPLPLEFRDEPVADNQTKPIIERKEIPAITFLEKCKFLVLMQNEGSIARDHLSNERTVLAWIRTSVSFATVGVGIVQLYNLSQESDQNKFKIAESFGKPLGISFILIALVTMVLATYRYYMTQNQLRSSYIEVSRISVIFVLLATVALISDCVKNYGVCQNYGTKSYFRDCVELITSELLQSQLNSHKNHCDEIMSSYKATLSSDDLPSSGGYADDVLRDRRNGSVPSFRQNSYVNMMEVIPNEPAQSKAPVVHFWDFGSLYLENKGSVARDHLASERTFLAWLRTSLSFATIGVGVTQLFKLSSSPDLEGNEMAKFARPLGLLFVLTSIVTLLFGVFRYFMIQKLLIDGLFPASRLFIGILLLIVSVLIVLTMVIVCLGNVQEL